MSSRNSLANFPPPRHDTHTDGHSCSVRGSSRSGSSFRTHFHFWMAHFYDVAADARVADATNVATHKCARGWSWRTRPPPLSLAQCSQVTASSVRLPLARREIPPRNQRRHAKIRDLSYIPHRGPIRVHAPRYSLSGTDTPYGDDILGVWRGGTRGTMLRRLELGF